ncbi:DegT/DnrJ/EryC1/StrS family aminotransferase [Halosolutus amylolyticus]|uniref:DegT/DnrJ/EryC1/StrS family aminotransferase n=1 Tax=Halosolutus amylolyticus TaxID=2932267 RepID=A0ABD5PP71_9EURY|nr:DegT/DnrJ/EryC1/StrS family aminotransferase [Halosolutus amylolyticus]
MSDDRIPLFEIAWDETDVEYATDSITRGSHWAKGPYVSLFEEKLVDYTGAAHAVVVNSGTTALVAALRAHGIGPGDEVIVPGFTFVATANAVDLVGATAAFADIERDTYGLDPASVREAITDRTAAIVPVHPYGSACRIDELVAIGDEFDVAVIEDAAEALGADLDGRAVGTFGDSTALSFCQNKVVATGEGGAVLTNDETLAENVRQYRSHGRLSGDYFESADSGTYGAVGTNYRMPDVVAAIGCAQIEKVEELIDGRRRAARRMTDAFESLSRVTPHRGTDRGRHVYQLYTVTLGDDVDRSTVVTALDERDISSKIYWDPPVHLLDHYRDGDGTDRGQLPVTEDVASRVLSLPIHPNLSVDETERIVAGVREAVDSQP